MDGCAHDHFIIVVPEIPEINDAGGEGKEWED